MPPLAGAQLLPNSDKGYGFEQYRWPEMFIKYSTEKMRSDLLDSRNKPLGTALVHADQPEGNIEKRIRLRAGGGVGKWVGG